MHVLYTERCVETLSSHDAATTPSLTPHAMYVVLFQAVARNMHKQAEAASLLKQLSSLEAKVSSFHTTPHVQHQQHSHNHDPPSWATASCHSGSSRSKPC